MIALKAQWAVTANLLFPGTADPKHSRAWSYTSADYEADGNQRGERFASMQGEAEEYAAKLQASGFNWVKLEYVWL